MLIATFAIFLGETRGGMCKRVDSWCPKGSWCETFSKIVAPSDPPTEIAEYEAHQRKNKAAGAKAKAEDRKSEAVAEKRAAKIYRTRYGERLADKGDKEAIAIGKQLSDEERNQQQICW
jgi:hypothetical protein